MTAPKPGLFWEQVQRQVLPESLLEVEGVKSIRLAEGFRVGPSATYRGVHSQKGPGIWHAGPYLGWRGPKQGWGDHHSSSTVNASTLSVNSLRSNMPKKNGQNKENTRKRVFPPPPPPNNAMVPDDKPIDEGVLGIEPRVCPKKCGLARNGKRSQTRGCKKTNVLTHRTQARQGPWPNCQEFGKRGTV